MSWYRVLYSIFFMLLSCPIAFAQNYDRSQECEREFLRFDALAPSGFGAFSVSKDGGCSWVNGQASDSAARLSALEKCENKTGFVCKVTHVKDDRLEKQNAQQRRADAEFLSQVCQYNPNHSGCPR